MLKGFPRQLAAMLFVSSDGLGEKVMIFAVGSWVALSKFLSWGSWASFLLPGAPKYFSRDSTEPPQTMPTLLCRLLHYSSEAHLRLIFDTGRVGVAVPDESRGAFNGGVESRTNC